MTLIWINNKYSSCNRREKIDGDSPPSEKRIFNTFSISIILEFEPNDGSMRLSLECCPLPTTRSRKKNNDEGKKKWFPFRRIQFDLIWFKDATISYLSTFSGSNNTATSEMITAIVKWLLFAWVFSKPIHSRTYHILVQIYIFESLLTRLFFCPLDEMNRSFSMITICA